MRLPDRFAPSRDRRRRCASAWPLLLVLAAASPALAQPEPRNVLLLNSFAREFSATAEVGAILRTELARQFPGPINFFEVFLQAAPAGEDLREEPILNYLLATFAGRHLNLAVTLGGPAATFAQKYRQQLFPATPLILGAVDARFLTNAPVAPNTTSVAVAHDPALTLETALRLLPRTKHVFVVIGSSRHELGWRRELDRVAQKFADRLTFAWTNDLALSQILERSAALPTDSLIFYALLALDAKGVPHSDGRTLPALRAAANAPIFGSHSTQLGLGIVGGPLMSIEDLGRQTTSVAMRILGGESPEQILPTLLPPGPPVFDWRELQRWSVSASLLPAGSTVRFREVTVWERYRWQIAGGITVALLEFGLVLALVVMQLRRRRAEQSLRESEERFRRLADTAPVMIWMTDETGLCTDVNRSGLEFTGRSLAQLLGRGWVSGMHPEDTAGALQTFQQAIDQRKTFSMEYRFRRPDGEYRWVLSTGVPRFTGGGSFVGYIGSAIDVTDLKEAKAALSNLSRRLLEAQEQERSWIARELHDDVCQRLTALTLHLEALRRGNGDLEAWRTGTQEVCGQIVRLGTDIQAISRRLHSSKLEYLGLVTVASAFCRDLSEQQGVVVRFVHEDVPRDLPLDVALTVFRVLQEALHNAVKHSGEREFDVTLHGFADDIALKVIDRGAGFEPETAMRGHGLGLISMRERVQLIRGELSIDSRPAAGTAIRVRAPFQPRSPIGSTDQRRTSDRTASV